MSDYMMRQIENMTRFVAKLIFAKRPAEVSIIEEDGGISQGNLLRFKLRNLMLEGHINEAENLLFSTAQQDPRDDYLPVALDFYEELSAAHSSELAAAGFSHAEVAEGLRDFCDLYGYDPAVHTNEEPD